MFTPDQAVQGLSEKQYQLAELWEGTSGLWVHTPALIGLVESTQLSSNLTLVTWKLKLKRLKLQQYKKSVMRTILKKTSFSLVSCTDMSWAVYACLKGRRGFVMGWPQLRDVIANAPIQRGSTLSTARHNSVCINWSRQNHMEQLSCHE